MSTHRKKAIAIEALSKSKTQTRISEENGVSRKFVRKHRDGAKAAVNDHFCERDEAILFTIDVTAAWIEKLVIALGLIARASFREIIYFIDTMFDHSISIGTVSSIFRSAIKSAKVENSKEDLSRIKITANDELYHLNKPILNGLDIRSLYCYLLSYENKRDEETWAIHLLDAQEKGLNPDVMVSDEGNGLLAGHIADCI